MKKLQKQKVTSFRWIGFALLFESVAAFVCCLLFLQFCALPYSKIYFLFVCFYFWSLPSPQKIFSLGLLLSLCFIGLWWFSWRSFFLDLLMEGCFELSFLKGFLHELQRQLGATLICLIAITPRALLCCFHSGG